jgi:hypothetical protein
MIERIAYDLRILSIACKSRVICCVIDLISFLCIAWGRSRTSPWKFTDYSLLDGDRDGERTDLGQRIII